MAAAARRSRSGTGTAATSASTASTRSAGACCESTARCCSGENPAVSPGSGARLSTTTRRARLPMIASAQLGHQQVRQHAGEPGARAEEEHVGGAHRGQRLRAGRRRVRAQPDPAHPARGGRHGHLAADPVARVRLVRPGR